MKANEFKTWMEAFNRMSRGQRVIGGIYHIQNVNAYDSRLK